MGSVLQDIRGIFHRLGWRGALVVSVVAGVGSIVLAALIIVRWPPDQFKTVTPPPFMAHRHPFVRAIGLVGKNIAGYLVILLGIVMALPGVPGQGVLMILIGLTLINFPGKRPLERKLIERPSILRAVNAIRARFKHPPLEVE